MENKLVIWMTRLASCVYVTLGGVILKFERPLDLRRAGWFRKDLFRPQKVFKKINLGIV